MKRFVSSGIGTGAALGVPAFAVVLLTGAGAKATYGIAFGFAAIAILWRRLDGSL